MDRKITTIKIKYKTILNILLNFNKYRKIECKSVRIIRNNGDKIYDKYIDKIGFVYGFEYQNFKNPIIIYFSKNEKYCFNFKDFEILKGDSND